MIKKFTSNHFFGGSGGGDAGLGGGVLGENCRVGIWWLPFIGMSPITVVLMAIIGALGVGVGVVFAAGAVGTKGFAGTWCDRVARSAGAGIGMFAAGLFSGVSI